jgi:hypothetical protein
LLPFIAMVVYLGVDTIGSSERLISCLGTVLIMGLGFIFSKYRAQVCSLEYYGKLFIYLYTVMNCVCKYNHPWYELGRGRGLSACLPCEYAGYNKSG